MGLEAVHGNCLQSVSQLHFEKLVSMLRFFEGDAESGRQGQGGATSLDIDETHPQLSQRPRSCPCIG